MIRRIELVNFMSHARTVIEPAEGLTVLVGPNNCGKSAVVAALQILCHGENSTYVTRHHERECSITIETDDGHAIEWRRRNSPSYRVDGMPFDRLGRSGLPEGLHDVLRLPKVSAEGNQEFDVHFGEQKSPVFLLDKPGSHAAQFFASSSDAASLVEMQKRHLQKLSEARKERARLDARFAQLSADLSNFAAIDAIGPNVVQVEEQYAQLQQSATFIAQLARELDELRRVTGVLEHHVSQSTALEPLPSPPELADPDPLTNFVQQIAKTQDDFNTQLVRARALEGLEPSPDVTEELALKALFDQLKAETMSLSRSANDCRALQELTPLPLLEDPRELDQLIGDVRSQQGQLSGMEGRLTALSRLNTAPDYVDKTGLEDDIRRLGVARRDLNREESTSNCLADVRIFPQTEDSSEWVHAIRLISDTMDEVKRLDQKVAETSKLHLAAAEDLRAFAIQKRICPTCGGALDPDRLVGLACSHGEGDALA